MELIVEDGTGKPDANSYVDLVFAQDYLRQDWSTEDSKQKGIIALIDATEYIDLRWGNLLLSSPLTAEQSLQVPRTQYKDRFDNVVIGVPVTWKRAVCLYASYALEGKLYPKSSAGKQAVSKKRITVGPVTTDYEYLEGSSANDWNVFPLADTLASASTTVGANAPPKRKGVMRN